MMASSQSIDGLIKWTRRDEWRRDFADTISRHVGSVCSAAGIEVDELPELIGDHWSTTLWGCAFEDLISKTLDEGRNFADDYLKRRGWKESASTRAYIAALRYSVVSLYEVSGIVVGESFLARDLVRGGEPVRVFEKSATRYLAQWDRIAARVMSVNGKTQISGGVLKFDHASSEEVLSSIDRVAKKAKREAAKLAKSLAVRRTIQRLNRQPRSTTSSQALLIQQCLATGCPRSDLSDRLLSR